MNSESLAIRQLRLVHAFRGYSTSILSCIDSTTMSRTMVVDDEESFYSHFSEAEDLKCRCLIVNNVEGHEIFLLAIDNKFISNYEGGIADCALFDETLFNFVEFKTNAEGSSVAQVESTYRKAMRQIESTYHLFKSKLSSAGVDFDKIIEIVGCVVVSDKFPRESAMEQSLKLEMAQTLHLELSFERELSFT